MKRIFFPRKTQDDEYESFTNDETHLIKHQDTIEGNGNVIGTMIYYEVTDTLMVKEKSRVNWIKEKTQSLALDNKFSALTNNTQRKFYLLENYGYNSVDALDIIEYLAMMKKLAEGK